MSNENRSVSSWVGAFCVGIATLAYLVMMVYTVIWMDTLYATSFAEQLIVLLAVLAPTGLSVTMTGMRVHQINKTYVRMRAVKRTVMIILGLAAAIISLAFSAFLIWEFVSFGSEVGLIVNIVLQGVAVIAHFINVSIACCCDSNNAISSREELPSSVVLVEPANLPLYPSLRGLENDMISRLEV